MLLFFIDSESETDKKKKKKTKAKKKDTDSSDFVPTRKRRYDKLLHGPLLSDEDNDDSKKPKGKKEKKYFIHIFFMYFVARVDIVS